ncbi:MAG: 3-hydroxyacyl-CoA dehydrogenase family protein [bacterium]|nr:3-hydroxyacyl-CoA dehydrogenase family protein [bacterium]
MSLWGLLGSAENREPWETYLRGKNISTVAIDRAPLHSLQEVEIALVVDTDWESNILQKLWLFESHMDLRAPIVANIVAASAAQYTPLCKHPERVVGMAVCPPLGKYNLEFTRTEISSDAAIATAKEKLGLLGIPMEVIGDRAGGVLPRTLAMLVNEACFALQEGLASASELDQAMLFGVNYPKGLLAWGDELGTQFVLDVLTGLLRETGDPRYRPAPLLVRRAAMGIALSA